jgi:hypothetical protein
MERQADVEREVVDAGAHGRRGGQLFARPSAAGRSSFINDSPLMTRAGLEPATYG